MNTFERAVGGMADIPQWIVWRLTPNASTRKYDKLPCTLDGSRCPINAGDSANWSDFDTVASAVTRLNATNGPVRYAMGFWITDDTPYWFLDLDHALGADDQWLPFAQQLVACYPSAFVEASSSGRGLHIIGMGEVPPHRNKPPREVAQRLLPLQLEFYTSGRGICFGLDQQAQGCADTRFNLEPLCTTYFPAHTIGERTITTGGFQGSDEELVQRALKARDSAAVAFAGRASFADLWNGRAEKNSDSDAALISRLAWWTNRDEPRIERLMRRSGMVRDKWNESRPGGTYLTHSISEISAKVESCYQEPTLTSPTSGDDGSASATSDLANARRLVNVHGQDMMHVPGIGWYIWTDDGPWRQDDGHAQRLAFGLGKIILAEANALDAWVSDEEVNGSDEQKRRADVQQALARWARSSEFVVSVRHTLEAAAPMLSAQAEQLDASPLLIGCPSGVIDLATCTMREHRREDRITKRIACDYDPTAHAPIWEAFVNQIMGGDTELIAYLQTLVGYIFSGVRGEHMLPILHGQGANGKSTFLTALQTLLGDYADTAAPGLLISRGGNDHPTGLASLQGRRLVVVSESGEAGKLNEEQIKQLTGGDRISARRMRQDFYTFAPSHIIALMTNHKPRVVGGDEGIWRRLKLIPFNVTIPAAKRDATLPQKLAGEFPGILTWAVAGWRMYQQSGLVEPAAVREATADYRSDSDHVGAFLSDRCIIGPEHTATASGLYMTYKIWCAEAGERPLTQRSLGLRLSERPGIEQARTMQARMWRGLAIDNHAALGQKGIPLLTVVKP